MHLPLGQNKAWAMKCPAHTVGIPCRKMPNAATDVIGHAAQLIQRKAKRVTPSQLYLVSFPAWDIFTSDTSLRVFFGWSGRSQSGSSCCWRRSHLPAGAWVSFSFTSSRSCFMRTQWTIGSCHHGKTRAKSTNLVEALKSYNVKARVILSEAKDLTIEAWIIMRQ